MSRRGLFIPAIAKLLGNFPFHEMKYIDSVIMDLKAMIKPETNILIAEQKFHVSKQMFDALISKMEYNGFVICERPEIFLAGPL